MGATCSCLRDEPKAQELNLENNVDLKTLGKAEFLTKENVKEKEYYILIQSLARAFLSQHRLLSQTNPVNEYYDKAQNQQDGLGLVSIKEIKGPIPDYSNAATQETAARMGPFLWDYDNSDGVQITSKGPVELDNGAIYTGSWSLDGMRHGKGIQV